MHRGMLLAPLAALTLGGCAQLFGIDNTTGADAGTGVSLAVRRVSVGASVTTSPQDLTGQTADFLVGDATGLVRNAAVIAGPGAWTADIPSGTPPALLHAADLPMTAHHLWALPSRGMRGNLVAYEHPNSTPPGASSQLALNVTLPAPYTTETLMVYAVGAWMRRTLTGAEVPRGDGNGREPDDPVRVVRAAGIDDHAARIAASDVVLVLRYVGADLTGVLPGHAVRSDRRHRPGRRHDGRGRARQDARHSRCPPIPQRYAARAARGRRAVGSELEPDRAPGAMAGIAFGFRSCWRLPAMTDTAVTAMFGDPFESSGGRAIFNLDSSASRTATIDAIPSR